MAAVSLRHEYLELPTGDRLAYRHITSETTSSPGVMYLNGFRSDMTGRKAVALEHHCRETNRSFVTFDYRGNGESSGNFMNLTLTHWIQDALYILDDVLSSSGPQILVGSSMGAWIALLVALQRPERVAGIVGVASAPDFTRDLWEDMPTEEKKELEVTGVYYRPSLYSDEPYPITLKLLEDAQQYYLLDKQSRIPLTCPVNLLHGKMDTDVSYEKSMALAERLESGNVAVTLIKNGNHRLSEGSDLHHIKSAVDGIAKQSLLG